MNWIQIKTTCKPESLYDVCAVMSVYDAHLQIDDSSDVVEANPVYGELIDEALLQRRDIASASFYVSEDVNAIEMASLIRDKLNAMNIECTVETVSMNEDDWADNWKQYYKPIRIGKTLVIVPEWEEFEAADGDLIIKMDPGMAFGTGTHETTQLCAELMEEYMPKDCKALDVGTGSGILAFAASKLGAKSVDAYDIDPVAVRVAAENALLNDCNNINFAQSDLLASVKGTYEFASANITADIVIRMSKDIRKHLCDGALLVVSGVIDEQRDAVVDAMSQNNMAFLHEIHKNGWSGLLFKAN